MMHNQPRYTFLNKQKLPLMIQPTTDKPADINCLVQFLKEENTLFKEHLLHYHAIIFRGFNINTPDHFSKAIQACDLGANYNYDFCPVPRTKIQEGISTSSNYPASYPIALHNEKSYSAEFPTHIFFNCIKAAEQGGCTSLADGHQIWLSLPEFLQQKLQSKGVLYRRHFYSYGIKYKIIQSLGVAPVFKTWMEEFNTHEKNKVETILQQTKQQFKWKGNDLVTEVFLPASRKHPLTGELVWFNQSNQLTHYCNGISDYVNSIIKNPIVSFILLRNNFHPYLIFYGDGTSFSKQESLLIAEAIQKNTHLISWQPGDLMVIDNYSCLHGKTPHVGERLILAGMTKYPYDKEDSDVS
ncbi:pyoverdine biosynthesis regulatory protein SyrP-like protein [Legionella gratiana]|uniref:Pyoverdine biosynthesis regulatory protein SyrP-like n=1 Tax=Legionella gratiana TaxID=45066 RepID=A0A378JE46_9GAMM|nr:TauD/TfdA family dioxygenase [Legionella gratiana]KTD10911.1 pyoverdine biosynthesis regulatory protein SyrP-like protein [Legionella gratiana]STX45885.1 pyoverdine biosynthesis regulatory protein SyrP-like [Legionella gratiana]